MHALGARVFGIRRQVDKKPDYLEALYRMDQIDDILPQCDIVALCLPNHLDTEGLFSRERIARMKQGAFLLNVGRGSAVDTEALCDALESSALAGAGLDVVEPEPLPKSHRLWNIKTAMILPIAPAVTNSVKFILLSSRSGLKTCAVCRRANPCLTVLTLKRDIVRNFLPAPYRASNTESASASNGMGCSALLLWRK